METYLDLSHATVIFNPNENILLHPQSTAALTVQRELAWHKLYRISPTYLYG